MKQQRTDPTRWLDAMEDEVRLVKQMAHRGYAMKPSFAERVYTVAVGAVLGAVAGLLAGLIVFLFVAALLVTQ